MHHRSCGAAPDKSMFKIAVRAMLQLLIATRKRLAGTYLTLAVGKKNICPWSHLTPVCWETSGRWNSKNSADASIVFWNTKMKDEERTSGVNLGRDILKFTASVLGGNSILNHIAMYAIMLQM